MGAGAGVGVDSRRDETTALAAFDEVLPFRAHEYETGGRGSNPQSPGARGLVAPEREQEKQAKEKIHAETGGGGDDVDEEPPQENRYMTSVAGLTPQADGGGGSGSDSSLEPLELLVKPPMPLIEEVVVPEDDGDSDGRDDGDGDDKEDDETSFHSISRRPSRSFSHVRKRASINVREQVSPGQGSGKIVKNVLS